MDNSMIESLRERIGTEPSVLILGQDYLRSKTGRNMFYELANTTLCNGELSSETNYTELWKHINGGKPLNAASFEKMREILPEIPEQNWLRKILNMRWGMVMTSAVDGVLYQRVGADFSMQLVDMDQRYFDRKYISKRTLNVSFLYGTIDGTSNSYPPIECTNSAFIKIRKKANDRINWIYDDILPEYGVMVIDGWNPNYDWMSTLLDNAGEMPCGSIFLFGANEDVLENQDIRSLIDNGILQADRRFFAQALEEIGFFEDTTEDIWRADNENGRTITIKANGDSVTLLSVPFNEITRLDTHITVLYDDIWHVGTDSRFDAHILYAKFQQQTIVPVWYLYDSYYGFYFERTRDQKLKEVVDKELRNNSYKRKYVILEGNSNVGKTASLVHLAYVERNVAPTIYISGEPSQVEWMKQLKEFIKNQIVNWQNAGKKVTSVLVIWDGNTDYNAVQRCKQLQDILRECNAVVVGSAYPLYQDQGEEFYYKDKGKNHHIILTANMDKEEVKNMLDSLRKVDIQMYEFMHKCVDKNRSHLLNVLQNIIHLQYRDEWRLVSEALMIRFNHEVVINEEFVEARIKEYKEELANRVNEEIHKYGVAAAWQLKLAQIREELWGEGEAIDEKEEEKRNAYENMERHIQKLNGILAVAGEFSVFIPLTLILRMISTVEEQILGNEQMFLINIIETDSLLCSRRDEQGYVSVSFRHRIEAEMYIENNFGNTLGERKEREVEFLKEMISECKWHDEQESTPILMLVRSFGPNSWGKLGMPRGRDRHYTDYEKWWLDIAECLKSKTENQPEEILVYALFIRSHCRKEIDKIERNMDLSVVEQKEKVRQQLNELNEAKRMLYDAIDQHDQNNKNQLCRLLGEMCANLVYEMKKTEEGEGVIRNQFQQLKDYFARAVNNWSENSSPNMFTKNALLDIWLNGVENYFERKGSKKDLMENPEFADAIADSIAYIDELLDLTEDNFDNTRLLNKVQEIYKYAGDENLSGLLGKIEMVNNDTYLYLRAWKCWEIQDELDFGNEEGEFLKNYMRNLYLIPDDFDRLEIGKETASKLKEYAQKAAVHALEILEAKKRMIESTKSIRCILMMIRAKWLCYTGNMPLETKQQPILTLEQWSEIGELCRKYIIYADNRGEKLRDTPVFLRMMYVWCFTKDARAFQELQGRQNMLNTNEWYFERLCLCNVGTKVPKLFRVNLQLRKGTKNKYSATIVAPVERTNDEIENNVKNRQVHVSDFVAQELMGKEFGVAKFNIDQPVVVWFNAKGPQIGLPEKGDQ